MSMYRVLPAVLLPWCIGAVFGADPQPTPAPVAPAPAAAAATAPVMEPAAFSFQLDSINFNSSVFFVQGNLQGGSTRERGTFSFTLRNGNPTPALSIQTVEIISAATDSGENLLEPVQPPSANAMRSAFHSAQSHPVETKQLNGTGMIKFPRKEAKSMTITGSVRVLYETKPVPPLDLTPASAWVGKKQDIPGCTNGFVLDSLKPLKYRCDRRVFSDGLLKDLSFFDKSGTQLHIFPMNASYDGDMAVILCNAPLPDDATISLAICGDPKVVTVPFTFKDVPLYTSRSLEHPPQALPQAPVPAPAPVKP
jgi:hypothetical protein